MDRRPNRTNRVGPSKPTTFRGPNGVGRPHTRPLSICCCFKSIFRFVAVHLSQQPSPPFRISATSHPPLHAAGDDSVEPLRSRRRRPCTAPYRASAPSRLAAAPPGTLSILTSPPSISGRSGRAPRRDSPDPRRCRLWFRVARPRILTGHPSVVRARADLMRDS